MIQSERKKIVDLLYQQEKILEKLYKIFAARFAEYEDFWNALAAEELRHAELVKKLALAEKQYWVSLKEEKITEKSISIFIEHVKDLALQAENGKIDLKSAVVHTLDLEKSLLEKKVFSRFEAMDARMKTVLTRLENETREHAARALALLKKIS